MVVGTEDQESEEVESPQKQGQQVVQLADLEEAKDSTVDKRSYPKTTTTTPGEPRQDHSKPKKKEKPVTKKVDSQVLESRA